MKAEELLRILRRADRPAPRYTSYPPANHFHDLKPERYECALTRASTEAETSLSAYLHLPFCHRLCTFCGCHSIKGEGRRSVEIYLNDLAREIVLISERLGPRRTLSQLHWGGGTPNYLNAEEMIRCFRLFDDLFGWTPEAERGAELDPSVLKEEQLSALRELGFNRISFGVQDLNEEVQRLIGRRQSAKQSRRAVDLARKIGFESLHLDLLYGLPGQTRKSLAATLDEVIALAPDRLSLFGFAYMPRLRPKQLELEIHRLPDAEARIHLYAESVERLTAGGYERIGMDHFARPEDPLSLAQKEGRLHRNFQGYTVQEAPDMIGFGISAISDIAGCYAQNSKDLRSYHAQLSAGELPTYRGFELSEEDQTRRAFITELMCNLAVDFEGFEARFPKTAPFAQLFAAEISRLSKLKEEGFLNYNTEGIEMASHAWPLARLVALAFDQYAQRDGAGYSQVI